MKKILVYIPAWGKTKYAEGISSFITNLYRYVNRAEFQFDILSFGEMKSFYEKDFHEMGGNIIVFPKHEKGINWRYEIAKQIADYVKKNCYDFVYFNYSLPYDNIIPFLFSKYVPNQKIIVHSHNSGIQASLKNIHKFVVGYLTKLLDSKEYIHFACSNSAAKWVFRKSNLDSVTFLNNGVDIDKFMYNEETRKQMRQAIGVKEDEFVIGHVGFFSIQKNQEFLIMLFDILRKESDKYKLILIGDGEDKDRITKEAECRKINENIIFTGAIKNVSDYLQAMDCFVMPSRYEGLPIVAIEAQAAGLPLILSDRITKETKLGANVSFLSLEDMSKWVTAIEELKNNYHRVDTSDLVKNSGYSMVSTARIFEQRLDREEAL